MLLFDRYDLGDCDCWQAYYMQLGVLNDTWANMSDCQVKPVPSGIDPCVYVTCNSGCQVGVDSGYINYLRLPFCELHEKTPGGSIIVLIIWLLILFVALGTTAEDFFCPSLAVSCSIDLPPSLLQAAPIVNNPCMTDPVFKQVQRYTKCTLDHNVYCIISFSLCALVVSIVSAGAVTIHPKNRLVSYTLTQLFDHH